MKDAHISMLNACFVVEMFIEAASRCCRPTVFLLSVTGRSAYLKLYCVQYGWSYLPSEEWPTLLPTAPRERNAYLQRLTNLNPHTLVT